MLSNQSKRELANKLIKYLTDKYCQTNVNVIPIWDNTSKMIHEASDVLNEPCYDVWKVHDLLRVLGRIELNNPNGRKGGRLINDTPVELPLNIDKKCDYKRCPLIKAMFRTFPELNTNSINHTHIWDDAYNNPARLFSHSHPKGDVPHGHNGAKYFKVEKQ